MAPKKSTLETSLRKGGAHHAIGRLAGAWEGPARTWFEPGRLGDSSRWVASGRVVLGGRFVVLEYRGTLMGEPHEGVLLLGHHLVRRASEAAWVDSAHTGTQILFSRGPATKRGASVLGWYPDGAGGPDWGWRTNVDVLGPDRWRLTMWNVTPEGRAARAVEVAFRRAR